MNRAWRAGVGAALIALGAPALAQGPGLQAARVVGTVERERDSSWASLDVAARIYDGERIRTGESGRAELLLAGTHPLQLGSSALALLFSSELANPPSRMGLARLVLERGALYVDAGGPGSRAPADLRINLGQLRMRIFGAEAWMETTPAGEEVCLLRGAIEIQTPNGAERLDQPGSCLRWGSVGVQRLAPDSVGPLDARLAMTALASQPAALATVPAEPPDGSPTPPVTAEPPVATGSARSWRLVLASLPTQAAATQEAERLLAQGIDVVVEPGEVRGRTTYRLTFGDYSSRAEAQQALRHERELAGFPRAWPLQLP